MQVEQSQTLWLNANQDLSYELEKALYQNKQLKAEVARLKAELQQYQQPQQPQQPVHETAGLGLHETASVSSLATSNADT